MFIHSPIARYKSKSAASRVETRPCTNVERDIGMQEDATERRGGGRGGRICDAARRRHGDVSCSSGPGRSFDIQLIRDQNRDSSESASHFETDSGRYP